MIKVAGLWEMGWNTPILEHCLWDSVCRDFGVDELCMCPVSGIDRSVIERLAIETYIKENPSFIPIVVDEKGDTRLQNFAHPFNALYLFGKAGRSLLPLGHQSIRIETPAKVGLMWPHQVLALVLYDRQVKLWQ